VSQKSQSLITEGGKHLTAFVASSPLNNDAVLGFNQILPKIINNLVGNAGATLTRFFTSADEYLLSFCPVTFKFFLVVSVDERRPLARITDVNFTVSKRFQIQNTSDETAETVSRTRTHGLVKTELKRPLSEVIKA
jgi:hypothetical protein